MSYTQITGLISQYQHNNTSINSQLHTLPQQSTYTAQHKQSQSIQSALYEQQELIENIVELTHELYNVQQKQSIIQQLEQFKQQLEAQNTKYNTYTSLLSTGRTVPRSASTGSSALSALSPEPNSTYININNDLDDQYKSQRERLLGTKNIVDNTGDSLHRTTYVLAETQQIGSETHQQLLQQREQFLKQKEMLGDTNNFLDRSKKVLGRMQRRIVTNQLIQYCIIGLEIALLLMIAYIKYWS